MSEAENTVPEESATADKPKRMNNAQLQKAVEQQAEDFQSFQNRMENQMQNILDSLQGMSAQNHPTGATRDHFEAAEQDQGGGGEAYFDDDPGGVTPFEGPPQLIKPRPGQTVDDPEFKAKQETLQFYAQMLDISIGPTTDEDAMDFFSISVNGRSYIFEYGKDYTNVPRYIVAGLAAARPAHYDNQHYVDSNGVRGYRYPMKRGLRYPFSVTHDPAGARGREWLRFELQKP